MWRSKLALSAYQPNQHLVPTKGWLQKELRKTLHARN
jgi:hypothetical protein